jgi:hypothetical protein
MKKTLLAAFPILIILSGFVLISFGGFGLATPTETSEEPSPSATPSPSSSSSPPPSLTPSPTPTPTPTITHTPTPSPTPAPTPTPTTTPTPSPTLTPTPSPTPTPTLTPTPSQTPQPSPSPPQKTTPTPTPSPTPTASPTNQSAFNVSGFILDSNGHGIAGANIIFNVPSIVPSVFSDSSGHYTIYAPAGTYHVNVWPPFDSNYIYYDLPQYVVDANATKNITLLTGYKVSGYIKDYHGTPVQGAVVSLNGFLCGWFSNYSGYYFVTAPAGTYRLSVVPNSGVSFPSYFEEGLVVQSNIIKSIVLRNPNNGSSTAQPTNTLNVQLEAKLDGEASLTNGKTHTSSQSAKLMLAAGATIGSSATVIYQYTAKLSSISAISAVTCFTNALPRFVLYLDTNGDGSKDLTLLSDHPTPSNGQWSISTGGLRLGWTKTNAAFSSYGATWQTLDEWKTEYPNARVLSIGVTLEYWTVADASGLGQSLYVDELMLNGTVNGAVYNIAPPQTTSNPTPSTNVLSLQMHPRFDGKAIFVAEKIHTSRMSVSLVVPASAHEDSFAMALYPYTGTLDSISTFSFATSYGNATPRFMLCLDPSNKGWATTFLLSDKLAASNGQWGTSTGGENLNWTQTNIELTSYGASWKSLDSWAATYGAAKVLFIGILVDYSTISPRGLGEPLYVDELTINGATYTIQPYYGW